MTIPTSAETSIAYYIGQKGLSKDVATGICAVLYVESTLNPASENNSGTDAGGVLNAKGAYGIAQWNGPRQQALKDFGTKKGLDPALLETQLAFVLTEAANSYPKFWAAIQTQGISYSDVIVAMVTYYEVPADIPGEIAAAQNYAKEFYTEVIQPTTGPAVAPVPAAPAPAPAPATVPSTPSLAVIQAQVTDAVSILNSVLASLKGTAT